MNDTERNRTVGWIVTIVIGLLVAVLVGILFGFQVAKSHIRKGFGMDGGQVLGVEKDAFVTFDPATGNCTQYVGGLPGNGGVLYARPSLSKSNGDTIKWLGPIASDQVMATFANSGPYGPFANTTYTTGPSSAPTGGQSDYSYTSLIIKHIDGSQSTCGNYQGMGVHVGD